MIFNFFLISINKAKNLSNDLNHGYLMNLLRSIYQTIYLCMGIYTYNFKKEKKPH